MADNHEPAPIVNFDAEQFVEHDQELRAKLRAAQPVPCPAIALNLLFEAACQDTGGGQAARSILYFLIGATDPEYPNSGGALELRRLDARHKAAAFEVLSWWAGPTESDELVHRIMDQFYARIATRRKSS